METYTSEENQELIDQIKGPRYYRVVLYGYGGEAAYIGLSKEQYEYWAPYVEEDGDDQIREYMLESEDKEKEDWELPDEAHFMYDEEGIPCSWFEHYNEFEHQWGVNFSYANLSIVEVEDNEYNSPERKDIVEDENLESYLDEVEVDENIDWNASDSDEPDYVLQFYSAEKGTFFEGIIETQGEFDPKKLKIYNYEFPNGEDVVTSIEYDGVEVDNAGGDTNGKGYSIYLWKNKQ